MDDSPVSEACRAELLRKVLKMYEEWLVGGWRYKWCGSAKPWDRSAGYEMVPIEQIPSPTQWLEEYTGEREPSYISGCGCDHRTYWDVVLDLSGEAVAAAYERSFGPDWRDEHDACEDELRLFCCVLEALNQETGTRPSNDRARQPQTVRRYLVEEHVIREVLYGRRYVVELPDGLTPDDIAPEDLAALAEAAGIEVEQWCDDWDSRSEIGDWEGPADEYMDGASWPEQYPVLRYAPEEIGEDNIA